MANDDDKGSGDASGKDGSGEEVVLDGKHLKGLSVADATVDAVNMKGASLQDVMGDGLSIVNGR
ncbi:MAG: hypothetical protein RIF41_14805, partial [Polyangiaceae bacterium]